MGEDRKVQGFGGKAQRRRSLGRPRHRWEDGIRMDLREIGWGSVDWIQLAQDRGRWWALVNMVMNLQVLVTRSLSASFTPLSCMSQLYSCSLVLLILVFEL
jgi:hypothetical protein